MTFDDEDRIVNPQPLEEDTVAEGALRHHSLEEFIGQHRVRAQLGLVLKAAKQADRSADHVLPVRATRLREDHVGDDRRGRTRSSVAHQLGTSDQSRGDLAALLTSLQPGEVLFWTKSTG